MAKETIIEFRSLLWPPNVAELYVVRPSIKPPRPRGKEDELVDRLIASLICDAKALTERR